MSSALPVLTSWLSGKSVQACLLVVFPMIYLAYRDYTAWYQLGPGGLPHNAKGWLLQTILRPICASDVRSTKYYDEYMEGIEAQMFLDPNVSERKGPNPKVGPWAAPHRQLEATSSPEMKKHVISMMDQIAASNPELLRVGPSVIEGGSPALFFSSTRSPPKHDYYTKSPFEVFHMHETDGSVHCMLSAADARLLVQKGWGQRHGLNGRVGLPRGYLMIFAPRNDDELLVLEQIAKAAGQYGLDGERVV